MPIIDVTVTGKQDAQRKRDFMEFAAGSICGHTSTLPNAMLGGITRADNYNW